MLTTCSSSVVGFFLDDTIIKTRNCVNLRIYCDSIIV
jgi:hypothetical protein